MGKLLEPTDAKVAELLARAISTWHAELGEAEVRFATIFVHPTESSPALLHRGFVVAADIRPASDLERALAGVDVILRIAADLWEEADERARLALLDHELCHIKVQKDRHNVLKAHADGRPKLGTREHDWVIEGFSEIVERHGNHAPELLQAESVREQCQLLFAFDTPRPPRSPREPISDKKMAALAQ